MKFFLVLRRFQQDVATLPHGHGGGFMGEGQSIGGNILLKTDFFDSLAYRFISVRFFTFSVFFCIIYIVLTKNSGVNQNNMR